MLRVDPGDDLVIKRDVYKRQDPAGADGTTAAAQRAGFDDGLPFMALFADPPR